MPGGVENPELGYAAFVGIKMLGYTYAGHYLNSKYEAKPSPWLFGATRTLIGMAVGGALYLVMDATSTESLDGYLLLVPIRIIEWLLVIVPFYDRQALDKKRLLKFAALGVLWSFLLDVPAGFIGFITAGVWIC